MSIKISRGGATDIEMTQGRRSSLALGACIGTFLLLFSTVAADVDRLERPPVILGYKDFALGVPTAEKNNAISKKIPSGVETEEFVRIDKRDKRDAEPALSELIKDAKAQDDEKAIDKDSEEQGIRPRNEIDGLSTSDSTNRDGSRFEETPRETSGKSSSTKTISDEFNRLSRTNDLIVVTAKPALDEPKFEQKTNQTVRETSHRETNKTNEPALLERETDAQAKFQSSSEELELADAFREPEILSTEQPRGTIAETRGDSSPTKNVEVPDLKETDANRGGSDQPISLINDTNVNYSHHRKTPTEKSLERSIETTAADFTSGDSAITRKPGDPKEDAEVVGNVTKNTAQRIEDGRPRDQSSRASDDNRESFDDSRKNVEVREPIDEKNQQESVESTTEKSPSEETASSLVPKGRTIAFTGINEFPNQETKPTTTARIPFSKKNITGEKVAELKPYPYAKSSAIKEEIRNGSDNRVGFHATTEEASALENTIGRGQADVKFIVTEASDVLENSIQQFKPTYYEKSGNESSTPSTTPLSPSVPATTVSPAALAPEPQPANQSAADGSIDPSKPEATGNDVPRWGEGREAITDKGNFDITGNGITEVSVKPESDNKRPFISESVDRTTATPLATIKPQGIPSNPDVRTNAESSLPIHSTLNAMELVTEYPLVKLPSNSTVTTVSESATRPKITTPPAPIETNLTEPSGSVSDSNGTNGTNEIPSGVASGPPNSDDEMPSTTTIEYEFVGLTETTTILGQNVTENDFATVPTIRDLFGNGSSDETTTVKSRTTVTDDKESTGGDDRSSTDQTTVPASAIDPTAQSRDDPTTQANLVQEETVRTNGATATVVWTTVTDDEDDAVTARTDDESLPPDSKDSVYAFDVTETSAESTVAASVGSATAATRVDSSSPFPPTSPPPDWIPLSSTASTPAASGIPAETTDDTKMSPAPEEITSLVRIVMEATWNEICPKIHQLKSALAQILATGTKRTVSNEQIMFHRQPPCPEVPSLTPTPSDMPLTSILVYVVDENGRFDSAMTTNLPNLYQESKETVKFPFKIHSFLLVQETIPDSGNAIAVVVVSVVAFICLVLLAGLLFIMRKRQTRFNYGERCRPVSLDAYSVDSVSAYNSVRRKGVARSSKRSYGNPTFEDSSAIPSHPLNFAGLSSFCNDVNAINEEFSSIPQVSAKIDELPTGAEVKNRYANVIPLPETRVPLQKIHNDILTEYINASYVRGPKNAMRYYIACQAPMESTVTDFWRMIWEQQCKVIIMLTDLVENGVEKCTEYIPPSEITDCHRLYGDFQVTLKKRETKEKYAISTLHLKNLENNTFREVYHIWYLWPVNGAQSDGAGLIAVLLEARALQRGGPGPIVVHCSPGTGRTGTLIALDLGIRQYEITRTVDVPRVVYTIRRDRAGAVQTKEQYAFIYKALNLYATKLAGGVLDST